MIEVSFILSIKNGFELVVLGSDKFPLDSKKADEKGFFVVALLISGSAEKWQRLPN